MDIIATTCLQIVKNVRTANYQDMISMELIVYAEHMTNRPHLIHSLPVTQYSVVEDFELVTNITTMHEVPRKHFFRFLRISEVFDSEFL